MAIAARAAADGGHGLTLVAEQLRAPASIRTVLLVRSGSLGAAAETRASAEIAFLKSCVSGNDIEPPASSRLVTAQPLEQSGSSPSTSS